MTGLLSSEAKGVSTVIVFEEVNNLFPSSVLSRALCHDKENLPLITKRCPESSGKELTISEPGLHCEILIFTIQSFLPRTLNVSTKIFHLITFFFMLLPRILVPDIKSAF